MAANTIKTRIQLKNDTEAHWDLATKFVPKQGEVIIYSAEKDTDDLPAGRNEPLPFSRLKVGDGETVVSDLPFIDSGSVNGQAIPTEVDQVTQKPLSSGGNTTQWYKLLLTGSQNLQSEETNTVNFLNNISADSKTETLRANGFRIKNKVELQWNDTDNSLDFVFI